LSEIVAPRNLFIEFMHVAQTATQLPTERSFKSLNFSKDFKCATLNGGV